MFQTQDGREAVVDYVDLFVYRVSRELQRRIRRGVVSSEVLLLIFLFCFILLLLFFWCVGIASLAPLKVMVYSFFCYLLLSLLYSSSLAWLFCCRCCFLLVDWLVARTYAAGSSNTRKFDSGADSRNRCVPYGEGKS